MQKDKDKKRFSWISNKITATAALFSIGGITLFGINPTINNNYANAQEEEDTAMINTAPISRKPMISITGNENKIGSLEADTLPDVPVLDVTGTGNSVGDTKVRVDNQK